MLVDLGEHMIQIKVVTALGELDFRQENASFDVIPPRALGEIGRANIGTVAAPPDDLWVKSPYQLADIAPGLAVQEFVENRNPDRDLLIKPSPEVKQDSVNRSQQWDVLP